ncbi:uncharacterized protein A1O9_08222 [Exophiala aquamarina CBS 119918]|uniref:Uncharacterized protein n=1 Tax=Exophiala aquamarina CBS 119918 TaxID=1182545 RepID=A0A072P6W5_9EURO|nr:uncharacterized protein A1O9_08222 [Exophiala aquamarina CBS 119918]KEF55472.1 hypothetical protein A1O9_08222 [Exophiala aquamarina CBS 119918]
MLQRNEPEENGLRRVLVHHSKCRRCGLSSTEHLLPHHCWARADPCLRHRHRRFRTGHPYHHRQWCIPEEDQSSGDRHHWMCHKFRVHDRHWHAVLFFKSWSLVGNCRTYESANIVPNEYTPSSWMAHRSRNPQLSIARKDIVNWHIRADAEHMVLHFRHAVHVQRGLGEPRCTHRFRLRTDKRLPHRHRIPLLSQHCRLVDRGD